MVEKQIEMLVRGSNVLRFHTQRTVKEETVGHHSNVVAGLLIILFPEYCNEVTLKYAVLHDLAEFVTGDVPSPIKRMVPELKEKLDEAELQVFSQYGIYLPGLVHKAAWVIKVCDNVAGILKLISEIGFGNTHAAEAMRNYGSYLELQLDSQLLKTGEITVPDETLSYVQSLIAASKALSVE